MHNMLRNYKILLYKDVKKTAWVPVLELFSKVEMLSSLLGEMHTNHLKGKGSLPTYLDFC